MPKVDIRVGNIQWPPKCCRCGSGQFSYRSRTEKIVAGSAVASVLTSVAEYREITLANVPVCDRCERARSLWFAGGVAAAAIGMILLLVIEKVGYEEALSPYVLSVFILAVLLAIIGTNKSPIRILRYDESTNSMKVQIYNREIASEMSRREAARTDLAGHADYLNKQKEKQRKSDRKDTLKARAFCILGFASGAYIVFQWEDTAGYPVMILSLVFWILVEIVNRRRE